MDSTTPSYVHAIDSTFNEIAGNQINHYHGFAGPHAPSIPAPGLHRLKLAFMDGSDRTECLLGTRSTLLQFITHWVRDPTHGHKVLWLRGLAGSGKSTVATTITNCFRQEGSLGAFVFFNRDIAERSDPGTVIRSLAFQIGVRFASAGTAISAAIDRFPDICESTFRLQFQQLLVDPLSSAGVLDGYPPIAIVIDALDECGTPRNRKSLLDILAEESIHLPAGIRLIITSRPERDIWDAFHHREHISALELDIKSHDNDADIAFYLRDRMVRIRKKSPLLWHGVDWPNHNDIQILTGRASGLFFWAATVAEFMDGHDPRRRLDMILQGDFASPTIDTFYRTALESVGSWEDVDFVEDFRAIVGVVLVAQDPLSSHTIDLLLCAPDNKPSRHTVSQLGCVLQQTPVRVLHPSFGEFLTTRSRCGRDIWFFDLATHHRILAIYCLRRLDTVLKRNMCNMTLSADLADEHLAEDVAYACTFWIEHVCAIGENASASTILEILDTFLCRHLLHWFEAMSIRRRSRDTIRLLDSLLIWTTSNFPNRNGLIEFVHDAYRFAQTFAKSIEEHPLLIYFAALPFTSTTSAIYRQFYNTHDFPSISGSIEPPSSPLLLVLEHESEVNSVTFSPDGTQIVSGSLDKTIRVWDAALGAEVLPAFRGHNSHAVAYSPDGTRIISGGSDKIIRMWDSKTGAEVLPPLQGHEDRILDVAFSPDGTRIVSGSRDKTLRIWDAKTGTEILPPLRGHGARVRSVAFSCDGTRVVSGSDDKTIRVWDAITGDTLNSLEGHGDWVSSVAFSSDGTRIVSGSNDKTIRVWDVMSGTECLAPLQGHENLVLDVAFSPDGSRIVSGSHDKTIRLWDTVSGNEILPPLRGHGSYVRSVSFSPDGTRIVSGSHDRTIRVWDATMRVMTPQASYGHESVVVTIAFSTDGTKIASGSSDQTIRVWDAMSGTEILPPLQGHTGRIRSVAFSLDGTRIISGSDDKTIRVWDVATGAVVLPPLRGHEDWVSSVAFSPDGSRIISGSDDHILRVWNASSGAPEVRPIWPGKNREKSVAFSPNGTHVVSTSDGGTIRVWHTLTGADTLPLLRGHEDQVLSVTFSPDGTRIVSGSRDKTLRIWDAKTGVEIVPPLRGHSARVRSVAFSPDGSRIVSSSDDSTLRVWDANTGAELLSLLQGHNEPVRSITYSPDGTRIVAGSDNTIRAWDALSGAELFPPFRGHTDRVGSVAFSSDGAHIASGSDDKTIRVWDTTTGEEVLPPLRGHAGRVLGIAFSPDGLRIVSGSADKTIRIWDTNTGAQAYPEIKGHRGLVRSVAFSSDGSRIVSGSDDGTNRIWDASFNHPLPLTIKLDYTPPDIPNCPISITSDAWVVHPATDRTISKLPAMIGRSCSVAYDRSLAIGTQGGHVVLMHFPPDAFMSPETRPSRVRVRERA